jgi:hypothetical protein
LIDEARLRERPALAAAGIAAAVRSFTVLLSTVGDGCQPTAAGYLPPAIVVALMRDLGWDEWWIGKGNREDWTTPVLELRTTATDLGLLRRRTGKLVVTPAGRGALADPGALWGLLIERCAVTRYPAMRDAVTLLLLLAARGEPLTRSRYAHRIRTLMNEHGWRGPSGDPRDAWGVSDLIQPTYELMGMLSFVAWGSTRDSEVVRSLPGIAFARAAPSSSPA